MTAPVLARDIGARGRSELVHALETMAAVTMGSGLKIHVVVAPNCAKASEMWEAAVLAAARCTIRWVPVGSGYEDDMTTVSRCLAAGTPEAVLELLHGSVTSEATAASFILAMKQQKIYGETVERMMWEATGRTPAVPTLVFVDRGGNARVIRGAIGWDRFPEVFESMGL